MILTKYKITPYIKLKISVNAHHNRYNSYKAFEKKNEWIKKKIEIFENQLEWQENVMTLMNY